jgi:NarL family two-component system response regulator LiaR
MNFKDKSPGKDELTASERKILSLIGKGKSSKEIAEELFISSKTVENHRSNICKKLGITGNSALLKYALRTTSQS